MIDTTRQPSTCDLPGLRSRPLTSYAEMTELWNQYDVLVCPRQFGKRFVTGFACSDLCVENALRLRYEVFCRELGHGIGHVNGSGLDRDELDAQMSHLVLVERESGRVVGTYRVQTVKRALANKGIYSAQEYVMDGLADYLDIASECGRACIAQDYRKATSLLALWAGLNTFLNLSGTRWLFGCSSLHSTDPDDGWRAMRALRAAGFLHPEILLPATPAYSCGAQEREFDAGLTGETTLPRLFKAYMQLGARVISMPALDREFGTIDFLVMADGRHVNMSSMGPAE
jgi:putative hemolysin